jgi:pimeloyl-ACP methyl ester carboxylesterase
MKTSGFYGCFAPGTSSVTCSRLFVHSLLAAALLFGACGAGGGPLAAAGLDRPAFEPSSDLPIGPSAGEMAAGYLRRAREYFKAACAMRKQGECRCVEGFFATCEAAWDALWTCPQGDLLVEAAELYNESLVGLLETAGEFQRFDPARGLLIGPPQQRAVVPVATHGLPVDCSGIESLLPTPPPGDKRISRCHLRHGFGLPVTLRAAPMAAARGACRTPQTAPAGRGTPLMAPAGGPGDTPGGFAAARQSLAATAVLRFSPPAQARPLTSVPGPLMLDPAPAVLDLLSPIEAAAVRIGCSRVPLAGDLTAPLLDMLACMPSEGISGFLTPYGRADTQARLEMLEPHCPGKIPVVFIHGLASDPGTWFDLLNELRTWPEFHRRFQAWVYRYPTGASFAMSSLQLRRQLRQAVQEADPTGRDTALGRMVLVGHSLGGLHAKMQVVHSGSAIYDSIARVPPESLRLPPDRREEFLSLFFFEPLPFIRRVVYIATPHGGSSVASRAVGRAASLLVRPPAEMRAIHGAIMDANPGAFTAEFERGVLTSVDLLEPSSRQLATLRCLRPDLAVATHSIIGCVHQSPLGGEGDCVVPVTSAREAGVSSEIFVPAQHTKVHHHPLAVQELIRILELHLRECGVAGGE